jgi:plasmid stabilization system protein ParE
MIQWSERAQRDLLRLYRFLAAKSPEAAGRAVDVILLGAMLLEEHPQVGRPITGAPPEFREWIIPFGSSAYIVRYRFDPHQVVVLAVRHGREAGF